MFTAFLSRAANSGVKLICIGQRSGCSWASDIATRSLCFMFPREYTMRRGRMGHGGEIILGGYAALADPIVVLHFCYVTFTVGGELVILLGGILRWAWVRGMAFRIAHLASVLLVAVEALTGTSCPLTVWEYKLRLLAGQRVEAQLSFVARLVRSIIFYDFPAWVFLLAYVGFAVAVGLTFVFLPPVRKPRN